MISGLKRTVAVHAQPHFDLEGHSELRQEIGLLAMGGGVVVGSLVTVSILRDSPPEQSETPTPTQNPESQPHVRGEAISRGDTPTQNQQPQPKESQPKQADGSEISTGAGYDPNRSRAWNIRLD
jgi:hypothetical protein